MKAKMNNLSNRLNALLTSAVKNFKPPEDITVTQWANRYRRLSSENFAESGLFKTSRTPYLQEPMDAFTDSRINRITIVASSQVGKTELELNMLGYVMDIDPGSVMFVMPTVDLGEDFSKRRVAAMIRDCKRLKSKVSDAKGKDSNNTVLKKSFPGGMLTITGANSPKSLAGTPARYVFGDERDRWPESAGAEGDPWGLLEARTTTFYNKKMVEVSTPTIKGYSAIEKAYNKGTMEHWCHQCPHCGEYSTIVFKDIDYTYDVDKIGEVKTFTVQSVLWGCPNCRASSTENDMKKQPTKWAAENPNAINGGHRSFWITAFASPWMNWETIVLKFLQAENDKNMLKTVYNTILGELWEERSDVETEDNLIARLEDYGAELPQGVLVLTCGVDTQDNRLEYEVVGHGHYGETWGIERGVIMGRPDTDEVWERLDGIIDHTYQFKDDKALKISLTCVDSGGHFTQEVYENCRARINKRVFAIKGKSADSVPFTKPPSKVPIRENKKITCWLYIIGVDAGKANIMDSLKVQTPGRLYSHFPKDPSKGYDTGFFNGLLSEKMTYNNGKWVWEKIPGHTRNEPLDCRNYALAAYRILNPDLKKIEGFLSGSRAEKTMQTEKPRTKKQARQGEYNDW